MVKLAAIAALVALPFFVAPMTKASGAPQNCTPGAPYPPYNSVCTGYGQSCYLAFDNCSTVNGTPGTWNPGGYTPCQNQYGC